MNGRLLVRRGLVHYWRTNVAVVLGVATAVAVLAGALLVGDSVRGSLRDLVDARLGRADRAVLSAGFVRERLAADVGATPIVILPGFVTGQDSGRRVGQVLVYGVDDRFWRFHGVAAVSGPEDRDAFLSPALARDLSVNPGDAVLVRVQQPSAIPLESLHGRKDDLGRTLRSTVRRILAPDLLGEFSLQPQQGDVRAVFVPLSRVQADLEVPGRVNALLLADAPGGQAALEPRLRERATLEDLGLRVRRLEGQRAIALEAEAGFLDDAQAAAATEAMGDLRGSARPLLTYLANVIRVNGREIPYSLVTATGLEGVAGGGPPPILLNEWAARDLGAEIGDAVTLDYYVWEEPGRLLTRSAEFVLMGIVPIETGDREMAPAYPGITDSPTLDGWDPPFPLDLRRVRPVDEDYWQRYRTTPKAFIPLQAGQQLWRSRYGALTSIRITPADGVALDDAALEQAAVEYAARLRARLDPLASTLAVRNVRDDARAASQGATNFGEYFVYFSFFLVVSALLLASLFFKLGVEQRSREVGLLRAVGYRGGPVRRLFLAEGLILAVAGSALGVLGAIGYAWLLMAGLRTWWVDAVGTTALTLHVVPASLAAGAVGGIAAAVGCTWWTLRGLESISERSLLAGDITPALVASGFSRKINPLRLAAFLAAIAALLLVYAAVTGGTSAGAFFGAGAALLGAWLAVSAHLWRRPPRGPVEGRGWTPVARLGLRYASYRPGRSVLSMAVIASATFILISVDAFRRDDAGAATDRSSGVGGYSVMVESLLPIVHDPATEEGRRELNLTALEASSIEPLRLLPGDDASCLNLYQPRNPRIVGVRAPFVEAGRFSFQSSLASTEEERANPWLLLRRIEADGAIPVIADANSMTYVLHLGLGEDFVMNVGGRPVRLRLVAALRDSIFQRELVMAESSFTALFPEQDGYRVLLVESAAGATAAATIESALVDFGADAVLTTERLAEFHRVENTYLSTFQTLGGLGLLLGTVGLAAVLLRNVLERRRELALLGAIGYRPAHFLLMVGAENALLLGGGLAAGAVCALIAIAPAAFERGSRLPLTSGAALLLFAVITTGLLSALAATRAVLREPLLRALRSE